MNQPAPRSGRSGGSGAPSSQIQRHGALIVLDRKARRIAQVSENVESAFGVPAEFLLGAPLDALLAADDARALRDCFASGTTESIRVRATGRGEPFDATTHLHDGIPLVEFERPPRAGTTSFLLRGAQRILDVIGRQSKMDDLVASAVVQLRAFLGSDCARIYRFDREWNFEVIAESCPEGTSPWRGLRFSGAFAPRCFREGLSAGSFHHVADVDADPVAMVPELHPELGSPTDLSDVSLRGLDRAHARHLRRIGVRGWCAVPLVVEDRIWGVAVGHHGMPLFLSGVARRTLASLGQVLSLRLESVIQRDREQLRARMHGARDEAYARVRSLADGVSSDFSSVALDLSSALLTAVRADGLISWSDGIVRCAGGAAIEGDPGALVEELIRLAGDGRIFVTDRLADHERLRTTLPGAGGVLALQLGSGCGVAWVRREFGLIPTAMPSRGAGEADSASGPGGIFELFTQDGSGRCSAWSAEELESARALMSLRDTFEFARADRSLRDSEARFRDFTRLSADWYWEQDAELRFTSISAPEGSEAGLGLRRWEQAGVDANDPVWGEHRRRLESREAIRSFEYRICGPDGTERWIRTSADPLFDSSGRFTGYRGVSHDISVERRAVLALEEQKARYQSLVDVAPDAILLTEQGRIVYANRNALLLHNAYPEQLLGKKVEELVDPGSHGLMRRRQELLRAGPTALPYAEFDIRTLDGRRVRVEGTAVSFSVDGRLMVQSVLRDISQRNLMEQDLREQEERLRRLVEGLPDGVLVLRDQQVVFANARSIVLFGATSPLDLLGRDPLSLFDPEERAEAALRLRAAAGTVEMRLRRLDGSMFIAEVSAASYVFRKLWHVQLVVRDITERRSAETALAESEARLAGLVESAMDAIISIDSERRVVLYNHAAEVMFGRSRDEMTGQSLDLLLPERSRGAHSMEIEAFARSGATSRSIGGVRAVHGLRADGSEFPVEASISLIRVNGRPLFTLILRDVTERRESDRALRERERDLRLLNESLEQRVAERTRELELSLKELEAFSYTVSHDLRAPLRALDAFSQMLEEQHAGGLPAEGRRFLGRVRSNAARMRTMLEHLLQLLRFWRQPLARSTVDMGRLARDLVDELRPADGEVEALVGELPPCDADPVLARQALANLIGNAFKYSAKRDHPRIEVGWTGEAYFVRDNGAGFDMRYADKLFGVFQRLHSEKEFEGTGVGLAIVHRIVERHGGSIRAEAAPERGATFFFTLG